MYIYNCHLPRMIAPLQIRKELDREVDAPALDVELACLLQLPAQRHRLRHEDQVAVAGQAPRHL